MNRFNQLIRGFLDTIPLGISVSIYGVVYGVLGGKTGLSAYEIAAMSAFIFAGASQIAAVQLIATGSSPLSVIATVFIINLRHYLLAASIAPYLKGVSTRMKMVSAYFMTDESYAVTYSHFQNNKPSAFYFLGSGLNIFIFWGSAGVLGCLFGNIIPSQFNYIFDFAFVAAFLGMLVPMVKDMPAVITVMVSAAISILGSIYLPGKWYIIIAGIVASVAGYTASRLKSDVEVEKSECREIIENGQ